MVLSSVLSHHRWPHVLSASRGVLRAAQLAVEL